MGCGGGWASTPRSVPCWPADASTRCWPGNTADSALIRQVKDDLRDWTLARVVWVADRGFASAANRRYLTRAGGHYILGERLRSGSAEAAAALARPGRYRQVVDHLQVKEVRLPEDIGAGDRFVVCFNPEAADRDKTIRERLVASLEEAIAGTDRLTATQRAELRGQLSTKPGLHRYLKTTTGGLLRIDAQAIAAAAPPPPKRPPRGAARDATQGRPPRGPASTASSCCAAPTPSSRPRTSPPATSS